MDLPRLASLAKYHERNPPLHVMVAKYLGYGETKAPQTEVNNEDDLAALMALCPQQF